ncbi:hypothetical protein [Terriglobus roseus]|uniref:4-hydroxybenzoate polyprenyltransferase n=1 Tax=Terriglobus roseus TaxID=392734 RepID=A0A1H4R2W3_9BACT|nr:hypothetical protein [Terriglobus roseus]SEC26239.1 hypothetical protein SAMN05443244_3039 [Terriglobus roseus]
MATALIAAQQTGSKARSPLALWHLLSLDAPTVAAIWTVYLARCFGVALPWTAPAALAVAVWMLYAADRVADAARGTDLRERHHFHQVHRHAFLGAMLGAVPVLAFLLILMPGTLRLAWMLQALPLAGYVAAVHAWRLPRVPKEHLVGIFFAVTCFMPALLVDPPAVTIVAMVLFGALCWLNCAALARWESTPRTAMDAGTAWASQHLQIACLALAAVAGISLLAMHLAAIAVPLALACIALALLDRLCRHWNPVHLRALADAALLTPVLTWPLLHLLSR